MRIVKTGRARQSLDYAPSLSSSLAPSSIAGSSVTASSSTSVSRGSLDLFKMDLSTLLRSHSISSNTGSRRHPALLTNQPEVVVVDGTGAAEMFRTPEEDSDRPARRKSKSENKFYRFLTQSRSRSSPRTTASASIPEDIASENVQNHEHSIHSRDSSWSSARSQKRPMSSATSSTSKPTILQSRPLSSTTTATNTTIMPPTPKARQPLSTSIPKPIFTSEPSSLAPSPPKSPISARKRLHNIFVRKTSISSSTNASPAQSNADLENGPAIPNQTDTFSEEGDGNAPHPKRNFNSQPISPSPFPRSRQSSSEPSTSTTNSNFIPSSKLENNFISKFFSGSRRPQSPPPVLSVSDSNHSNNAGSPMPTPSSSNSGLSNANHHVPVVSGPSRQTSTSKTSRRRASTNESISSVSSIQRAAHVHAPQPRPVPSAEVSIFVPRITHTPATPLRSGTAPPRLSQTHRNDSLDSGYRYRPLVMDMVDEERDPKEMDVKGKGKEKDELIRSRTPSKGKESDHSSASGHKASSANHPHHHHSTRHQAVKPKTSNITSIRSAKHGSFDFERPGWGLGANTVTRSLSGTSGNSGVTGFSGGRYSNRSGETVDTTSRVGDLAKRNKSTGVTTSSKREEYKSQKRNAPVDDDPAPPYSPIPASTDAGPGSGLSSSLGRSAGKRTGIARLIGLGGHTTHGAFPFEPPVPSPISPAFSHASQESNAAHGRKEEEEGKDQRRKERDDEKLKTRVKDKNRYSEQNTPGVSSSSSTSSKPARKGRSLDLGIGLSWAPTKVREDVLLPGGIFANMRGLNGRISDSTSSRNGLRTGRDRAIDEFGVADRSQVGRDVAEMFKKVLDPEGYRAFKKYVHQFDAHEISFDGPNGIIARARRLLDKRSDLGEESKKRLVDRLVKIVLQNA
ncbi:hypothetical protein DFH05DRAFT_345716 [Lentinula detonsa]|uniref:Uncharacterized protein n=1 Tax=Lentinula detonsa TaxID=2804962 RepID=A0A9W8TUV4_9AGAR|nr:hypothetical protein DFH05DRAFT_345716 [Lentinula detonsa]